MLSKDELYRIWAPPDARWSRWVKPVLFAFTDAIIQSIPARAIQFQCEWVPSPGLAAILLDVPEEEGVLWGMKIAELGYQPVPLYNALPFPPSEKMTDPSSRPAATVPVERILATLVSGAESLQLLKLPPDAPPVFLLDSMRRVARTEVRPGVFDNRSICFTTDFPSAEFLISSGIRKIIVVQESTAFAPDLLETLVCWQSGGVQIFLKERTGIADPAAVTARRPSVLKRLWLRVAFALGMHKGELGGFGGIVTTSAG